MLCQQVLQHLRVLPSDSGSQNGEYTNRQPKIDRKTVDVASAGASAGAKDHFVTIKIGDDLIDKGEHSAAPAIHNALPPDLHDIYPWQDRESGYLLSRFLNRCVAE